MGVAHSTVREQQLHTKHPHEVHALTPADFAHRVVFSQWLLQSCVFDLRFPYYVLFTDEACFTRDGMFNRRNIHVQADTNPCTTVARSHQVIFAVNMWTGVANTT